MVSQDHGMLLQIVLEGLGEQEKKDRGMLLIAAAEVSEQKEKEGHRLELHVEIIQCDNMVTGGKYDHCGFTPPTSLW